MDKYLYGKLNCELKMEDCEPWEKAYQAAMETDRRQECNDLFDAFQSAPCYSCDPSPLCSSSYAFCLALVNAIRTLPGLIPSSSPISFVDISNM